MADTEPRDLVAEARTMAALARRGGPARFGAHAAADVCRMLVELADRVAALEAAERQAAEAVSKTVARFSATITERDRLRAFAADLHQHGLRCDLTPTANFGVDAGQMYTNLTGYFRDADQAIRDRARALLPTEEADRV